MKQSVFLLTSLIVLSTFKISYQKHRGFSEVFLQNPGSSNSVFWLDPEAQDVFSKPLTYLASGRQCFVFESYDKTKVVKFISAKRFLNDSAWDKVLRKREEKITHLKDLEYTSYHLAGSMLKNESKLLGLKLGRSQNLGKITLIDPWGITKTINLNEAEFLIQPKAIALKEVLKDTSNIQESMSCVIALLKARQDKNIIDLDPRIHRNVGFHQNEPFFLDLGAFKELREFSISEKQHELDKILNYNQTYIPKSHE